MKKEELKDKILGIIKNYPIGSLATIKDGRPWARYMVMWAGEDMALYTTTSVSSRKIEQIKKDAHVHVTFGADPKDYSLPYINVEGSAEILTDVETRKKQWREPLKEFFTGPEDPNYVVIKVSPSVMEYMGAGSHTPAVYKP